MNLRESLVLNAGGLLASGFKERASSFGAAGRDRLERLNFLLTRAGRPAGLRRRLRRAAGRGGTGFGRGSF